MSISKELSLPNGFQSWNQEWVDGIYIDNIRNLRFYLEHHKDTPCKVYTQHQVFYENGVLKQTRSSPNWDGGMVTYATCKHFMRSQKSKNWEGTIVCGLCPKHCKENCLLFVGAVWKQFPSNYTLSGVLNTTYPKIYRAKLSLYNPRGDLYVPKSILNGTKEIHNHTNYVAPINHTRSVEYYASSPGSVGDEHGVPKWWRDIEYLPNHGNRPKVFIMNPCWLFSKPLLWSLVAPGRAVVNLTAKQLLDSFVGHPNAT